MNSKINCVYAFAFLVMLCASNSEAANLTKRCLWWCDREGQAAADIEMSESADVLFDCFSKFVDDLQSRAAQSDSCDQVMSDEPCTSEPPAPNVAESVLDIENFSARSTQESSDEGMRAAEAEMNRQDYVKRLRDRHKLDQPEQNVSGASKSVLIEKNAKIIPVKKIEKKPLKKKSKKKHKSTRKSGSNADRKYLCETCDREFNSLRNFARHKKEQHSEDKGLIYICKFCKKKFKRDESYIGHLNTHEENEDRNPFYCDICSEPCNSKRQLRNHIKRTHMENFIEDASED